MQASDDGLDDGRDDGRDDWHDVGDAAALATRRVQEVRVAGAPIALTCVDGEFRAVSGVCNHVGGPLGQGQLDGDYLVCPWHQWKFHRATGQGEAGFEGDQIPVHDVRVVDGRVQVRGRPTVRRKKKPLWSNLTNHALFTVIRQK